jgi:hypothetical protein
MEIWSLDVGQNLSDPRVRVMDLRASGQGYPSDRVNETNGSDPVT